jgi:hypothetical protein
VWQHPTVEHVSPARRLNIFSNQVANKNRQTYHCDRASFFIGNHVSGLSNFPTPATVKQVTPDLLIGSTRIRDDFICVDELRDREPFC